MKSNRHHLLKTAVLTAGLALTGFGTSQNALAQSSATSISFQGALNGPGGQPLPNGDYNLTFRFWDEPAPGGNPVSTNITVPNVPVAGGVASTAIPVDPVWFNGQTRYMGVHVGGGSELLPRVLVTAVPYAMTAESLKPGATLTQLHLEYGTNAQGHRDYLTIGPDSPGHRKPLLITTEAPGITFKSPRDPEANIDAHWDLTGDAFFNGNIGFVRWRFDEAEAHPAFVISSNLSVGIGTASPRAKLDIRGYGAVLNVGEVPASYPGTLSLVGSSAGIVFQSPNDPSAGTLGRWSMGTDQFANGNFGIVRWPNHETLALAPLLIRPNGNVGINNLNPQSALDVDGTTRTRVLQITGGADLAEHLSVTDPNPGDEFRVEPGMVVSIDSTGARKFKLSDEQYDRKRVGIISGGNGVKPGLVLRDEGNPQADGEHPIALSGQVWCHADASFGPIEPGDLLTTSSTPGHAMRVSDFDRARFAVLGQALTGLKEGRGWVQVLVGKQ
jgi:hypothetical protein